MKENQLPRLDAFCSKDDLRPVMNCVFIDGNYAVASDAHILVKMDVSMRFDKIELMNGKLIHCAVWFNMLYATQRIATETGITCHFQNYICEFRYDKSGQYPKYMDVLNNVFNTYENAGPSKYVILTPTLLARLSKITSEPIHFGFSEQDERGILMMNDDFHGVIMPCAGECRINELKNNL